MVREIKFNMAGMTGKPIVGKPIRFEGNVIGHIVKIDGNNAICMIDDNDGLMSQLRSNNFISVEVVRK